MSDPRDEIESTDIPGRRGPEGVRILGAEEAQAVLDNGQVARRRGDDDLLRYGDVPARPAPNTRPTVRFPLSARSEAAPSRAETFEAGGIHDVELRRGHGDVTGEFDPMSDVDHEIVLADVEAEENEASMSYSTWRRMRNAARLGDRGSWSDAMEDDFEDSEPADEADGGFDQIQRDTSSGVQLPHWTDPPTGEVLRILPEAEPVDMTGDTDYEPWASRAGPPRFRSGAGDWAEEDYGLGESLKDDPGEVRGVAREHQDPEDVSFEEAVAARRRRTTRRISATAGGTGTPPRGRPTPEPAAGAAPERRAPGARERAGSVGSAAASGVVAAGAAGIASAGAGVAPAPGISRPAPAGQSGARLGAQGGESGRRQAGGAGEAGQRAQGAGQRVRRRPGLEPGDDPRHAPPAVVPAALGTRVVTGVGLGAIALMCFALGPLTTTVLVVVIVALGAIELSTALRGLGYDVATLVAAVGSAGLVIGAYQSGLDAFPLVTVMVVVFSMLWYLFEVVVARPVVNISMTMMVYGYVGVLGGFAGLILSGRPSNNGVGLLLGGAICAVGYDTFGYLIGSRFGKRRIAPKLSPNKSLEGLIGGTIASILLGVFVTEVLGLAPWDLATTSSLVVGLTLGGIVAVLAPLGDLCESMIKRDLGVKDLGTMFPGHGGILDRFDSVLFCLPAIYYLARVLEIG